MRPINWDQRLSDQDVSWLLQSGIPHVVERIRLNLDQYPQVSAEDPKVPDEEPGESEEDEPYDRWTVEDLQAEVDFRTRETPHPVEVTGTGKNGNVLKSDLIAALSKWDETHGDN